jgi:hypothetical protein
MTFLLTAVFNALAGSGGGVPTVGYTYIPVPVHKGDFLKPKYFAMDRWNFAA